MDGLQYRLEEEMDPATKLLVNQLASEEGGMSQHTILAMACGHTFKPSDGTTSNIRVKPASASTSTSTHTATTHPLTVGHGEKKVDQPPSSLPTIESVNTNEPVKLRRRKRPNSSHEASSTSGTSNSNSNSNSSTSTNMEPAMKISKQDHPLTKSNEVPITSEIQDEDFATMLASIEEAFDEPDMANNSTTTAASVSLTASSLASGSYMSDMSYSSTSPSFMTTTTTSGSESPSSYSPSHSTMGSPASAYSPYSPPHLSNDVPIAPPTNSRQASLLRQLSIGGCHSRWFNTSSTRSFLPFLPSAILSRILLYLDATTLCGISRCSRALVQPGNDSRVWSTMYVRRWPVSCGREKVNWKLRYREREEKELIELLAGSSNSTDWSSTAASSSSSPSTSPLINLSDPLSISFRIRNRALATRHLRTRDEFELIDEWARSNRTVYQVMQSLPGGVEGHGARCGRDFGCKYLHYPPDLWICRETGWVHFCGPQSDQPSEPIFIPPLEKDPTDDTDDSNTKGNNPVTQVQEDETDGEILLPTIPPNSSKRQLPSTTTAAPSTSSTRIHHCVYLDSSSASTSFHTTLRSLRSLPLHQCPISLREDVSDRSRGDDDDDDMSDDENRQIRGGSPEPEEACGRGSFLTQCFLHGYGSESIGAASRVFGADEMEDGLQPITSSHHRTTNTTHSSELEVIQRGRLFGLAIGCGPPTKLKRTDE